MCKLTSKTPQMLLMVIGQGKEEMKGMPTGRIMTEIVIVMLVRNIEDLDRDQIQATDEKESQAV